MSKTAGVRGPAAAAATVVLAAFGTGGVSVWFAREARQRLDAALKRVLTPG
ncbi:MAG: hypothetical protein HYY25_16130 [Candidatus Wallbacteria bacterium]|nr:hypothetical protein [Candidatus Wallbacteria bacterium]